MRTRSISGIKCAARGDGGSTEEVGRIMIDDRVFVVVRAPKSPLRSVPGQTCRFKIDGFEFAAIETPEHSAHRNEASEVASRLTGRELEIAVLVAQGCATKNIAFCGSANGRLRPISGASSPSLMSRAAPRWCIVARH